MTSDLSSLIERIEKSEGADRELDASIAPLQGLRVVDEGHPIGRMCYDGNGLAQSLPRYTASIDAAMTLVPTGWIVEIRRYFNNDGEFVSAVFLTDSFTVGRGCDPEEEVTVSSRIVERRQGIDPTPLALCASALKARNPSHEG